VYTGMPMGHPLGFPGQRFRQLQVLRMLLDHARQISRPGTLVDLDLSESADPFVACPTCGHQGL
jgi:hypothetical protein